MARHEPLEPLPVSHSGEGGNTLRQRRRRAKPAVNPHDGESGGNASVGDGRPAARRLAQFVPLHSGSGLASTVVVPGLFRPTGSYNRRRR